MCTVLTWILVYLTGVCGGHALGDANPTETEAPDTVLLGATRDFWGDDSSSSATEGFDQFDMLLSYVDFTTVDYSSLNTFGEYMELESTQQFISSFSTDFERLLVAKQLEYCPLLSLCSFSLNNTASIGQVSCCGTCSCEPDCMKHNNCCPDKVLTYRASADKPIKQCLHLRLNTNLLTSPFDQVSVVHIISCPEATAKTASMLCERDYNADGTTLFDVVPVVNKFTAEVYRNVHCAACNNVSRENLEFFEAKLGCKVNSTITDAEMDPVKTVLSSTNCDIQFSQSSYLVEECKSAISECNVTGKWMTFDEDYTKACKLYTSEVKDIVGYTYSNIFCALCNGITNVPLECKDIHHNFGLQVTGYPFTTLLSFTPSDERIAHSILEEDELATEAYCESNQMYSEILVDCVDVVCSPLRTLQNGTCERQVQEYDSYYYQIKFRLQPLSHLSLRAAYSDASEVLRQLGNTVRINDPRLRLDFCVPDVLLKTNLSVNQHMTKELLDGVNLEAYYIKVKAHIQGKHDPENILEKVELLDFVVYPSMTVTLNTASPAVYNITVIDKYDGDFDIVSVLRQSGSTSPDLDFPLKPLESIVSHAFWSEAAKSVLVPFIASGVNCKQGVEYISVSHLKPCPLCKLSRNQVLWEVNDSGLIFRNTNRTLDLEDFHLAVSNSDIALICCDKYEILCSELNCKSSKGHRMNGTEPKLSVGFVLSLVFVGLSLACLCITLFTFILLPALWSLPGKNNMALVVSLMLAQTSYLISCLAEFKAASLPCKVIGILAHFFVLLAIFWMQICTFHMYTLFSKTRAPDSQTDMKRYFLYHAYCVFMSLSCVFINIVVSSYAMKPSSLGYGERVCHISSQQMIAYTLRLPLAFVVVSNLVMFVLVIISIRRSSMTSGALKNERNQLAIFARLSTITGITLAFGFLYIWTKLPVLSYVFTVLNGGQGIYIMVAFVCNARVLKMFRHRFKGATSTGTSTTDTKSPSSNV